MQCWAELHFVGLSKWSFKECFLMDINVKTRAEVSWAAGGRGHGTRAGLGIVMASNIHIIDFYVLIHILIITCPRFIPINCMKLPHKRKTLANIAPCMRIVIFHTAVCQWQLSWQGHPALLSRVNWPTLNTEHFHCSWPPPIFTSLAFLNSDIDSVINFCRKSVSFLKAPG